MFFTTDDIIHEYSRAQAIADGVLIDVSEVAKEAGFHYPVALTEQVWIDYVAWEAKDNQAQTYQDTAGRLWDVLSMLRWAIRANKESTSMILFKLYVIPRDGRSRKPVLVELKSICGPGDEGEPVITILKPNED